MLASLAACMIPSPINLPNAACTRPPSFCFVVVLFKASRKNLVASTGSSPSSINLLNASIIPETWLCSAMFISVIARASSLMFSISRISLLSISFAPIKFSLASVGTSRSSIRSVTKSSLSPGIVSLLETYALILSSSVVRIRFGSPMS